MSQPDDELPRLGSLAAVARNKHIRRARTTLIAVGILMVIGQTAMYFIEKNMMRSELQKLIQREHPGAVVSPEEMDELEDSAQRMLLLFNGGAVAVGLAFIVMGFFVERHPVSITTAALVLFIALQLIFAAIDPRNLCMGVIVKVIVIVFLVQALRAGIAAAKADDVNPEAAA